MRTTKAKYKRKNNIFSSLNYKIIINYSYPSNINA